MRYIVQLALLVLLLAFALTVILSFLDSLFTGEPVTTGDIVTDFVEMLVLSTAMVASASIAGRLRGLENTTLSMRDDLSAAADAGRAWRAQSQHLFQGLSAAIASQFESWELTDAESEIAALILKGAPLKDIATLRQTTEATIRQQAHSVYRKSGLANRSELAAYFLEDLFDVAGAQVSFQKISEATH